MEFYAKDQMVIPTTEHSASLTEYSKRTFIGFFILHSDG